MNLNTITLNGQHLTPSKVICIGRNYVDHIHELKNEVPDQMVVFIKPNSSISPELQSVHVEALHYEGEICFLVRNNNFEAVGFGLDLTKRGLQTRLKDKGLPWERAKAFDGSALFSPFVKIAGIDPALTIQLEINNSIIQNGGVQSMIYKPELILTELQTFLTLNDGDIVMTGTPKGVGVVTRGDAFTGKILCGDEVLTQASWTAA